MMRTFALRLNPHEDLKVALQRFVAAEEIQAGCVVSAVGSLEQATLRFAGRSVPRLLKRRFEIVSLGGTLAPNGVHLHLSLADAWGKLTGGHLMEGCLVYTTVELVLAELPEYVFKREFDRHTGYLELKIQEVSLPPWMKPQSLRSRDLLLDRDRSIERSMTERSD